MNIAQKLNVDKICRICYQTENPLTGKKDLISPCGCKGSLEFVHKNCLKNWHFRGKRLRDIERCDQCLLEYKLKTFKAPNIILVHIISLLFTYSIIKSSEYILHHIFTILEILLDYEYPIIDQNEPAYLIYYKTLIFVAITYQLVFDFRIISATNYIFTVWRIVKFNFLIDNFIAVCITIHLIIKMYRDIYQNIEQVYVFVINNK
ncbi:E3 ubiquitin-protein ligase MARCH5 [Dictyocoela muelleri]|nr:E3 ubiquitin-protein ligase MARCH5 [Dictyocoela muelleri]